MSFSLTRYRYALLLGLALALFSLAFLPNGLHRVTPWATASSPGIVTATVSPNPLTVTVVPPKSSVVGKAFTIKAEVENGGEVVVKNASAEILLPAGLILSRGDAQKNIGKIPALRTKSVSWRVLAAEVGDYIVIVQVSGEVNAQVITEQDSAIITVTEPRPKGKNALILFFQQIFDALTDRFR